jgi:uncharacterized Zn finger protein
MGWRGGWGYGYGWRPYVPAAVKRADGLKQATAIAKKQRRALAPVAIEGRKIAKSFWGEAWCANLERYSDFANRLPRGRTYVRNGSVVDLIIERGKIQALVSGSELYTVKVSIRTLKEAAWNKIKHDCSQSIASLLDLLQGKFDEGVMQRLTERDGGLFPQPAEIQMDCSCPDYADLCKHVAAVLYGVGARLDRSPELLFTLRDVDHVELIGQAASAENLDQALGSAQAGALAGSDLGELFGIELDAGGATPIRPEAKKTVKRPARAKNPGRGPVRKPAPAVAAVECAPAKRAARPATGTKKKKKTVRKRPNPRPAALSVTRSK